MRVLFIIWQRICNLILILINLVSVIRYIVYYDSNCLYLILCSRSHFGVNDVIEEEED